MTTNSLLYYIFKYLSMTNEQRLSSFLEDTINREYSEFNEEDIINSLNESLSENICFHLKPGYNDINAALNHTWDYEVNGRFAHRMESEKMGKEIEHIIEDQGISYGDKKVYIEASLGDFKDYAVYSFSDISKMKGKYILDGGLVKTSIKNTNSKIKIAYCIPKEFKDGVLLSIEEDEDKKEITYLMNRENLCFIKDVIIDETTKNIELVAIVIPKVVYDDYYQKKEKEQIQKR